VPDTDEGYGIMKKKYYNSLLSIFVICALFAMRSCNTPNYDEIFTKADQILSQLEKEGNDMSESEVKDQLLQFFKTFESIQSELNSDEKIEEFRTTPEYGQMKQFNERLINLRKNNQSVNELIKDPEIVIAVINAGF